jgi:hypothetical protein
MDPSQAPPWMQEWMSEKVTIFRRLVGTLLGLIAAMFILMMWVLGSPDSYQEHQAAAGPSATWPDGSAKTGQDWWANAGGRPAGQVAQPPASPAQPEPNRG